MTIRSLAFLTACLMAASAVPAPSVMDASAQGQDATKSVPVQEPARHESPDTASGAAPASTPAAAPAPAPAAPTAAAVVEPPGDAFRIGPEDVLDVQVWKNPELSRVVPVRPDGMISLPLVNDIRIKISGCPNSCGQHHIADIGFYGMAIRMGERQVPAFQLMLGGNGQGEGRLGKVTMKIPARQIPDAVEKLVDTYVAERTDGEAFRDWYDRAGVPHVQEVLADYKIVPEFNKDPMAYVDWGQSKFFTLDDMGEGECAV